MPNYRFHLLSVIILLAVVSLLNGCGDAEDSYEGDTIEEIVKQERQSIEIDETAPVLSEVTGINSITNESTPSFTFSSTEAGAISYVSTCSSDTSLAVKGNNLIRFNFLSDGNHTDCVIRVKDLAGNQGSLTVSAFVIDTQAPVLNELIPIASRSNDTTPSLVFSSSKSGALSFGGDCSSPITTAFNGSNTLTLSALPEGSYNGCTIRLTDSAGNQGSLSLSAFTVDKTQPELLTVIPSDKETSVVLEPSVSMTFTEGIEISTLTVNTSNNVCSGSLQLSSDNFSTCVQMSVSPSVSNGGQTFTVVPAVNLLSKTTYRIRISTDVRDLYGNPFAFFETSAGFTTIDTTIPSLTEVTAVASPIKDNTPSYVFSTTEAGTISYRGSCTSGDTIANLGVNTVTFNSLTDGTYTDCTIKVTDSRGNDGLLAVTPFSLDTSNPILDSLSPVDGATGIAVGTTVELIFSESLDASTLIVNTVNTTCSGSIQVSADNFSNCVKIDSSPSAYDSNTSFSLKPSSSLTETTTYKIRVTTDVKDTAGNPLDNVYETLLGFTISDITPPVLSEVTAVPSHSNNISPSYTFHSNEAGMISFEGSCARDNATASIGNNTLAFTSLGEGIYINCAIKVTDNAGNQGILNMTDFVIDASPPAISSIRPADSLNNVSITSSIVLSFSEAMDTSTVTVNTDNTTCSGSLQVSSDNFSSCIKMSGSPSASNSKKFFRLTPLLNLSGETTYKVRVTKDVKDTAGNNLSNNYQSSMGFTTIDISYPVLKEVTRVTAHTNDPTPGYTFNSNETGTLTHGGSCRSDNTSAGSGNNRIDFNTLSEGVYFDCSIKVTDPMGNRGFLYVNPFIIDTTPPSVTSLSPLDNTTILSLRTPIEVRFSESMDVSTLTTNIANTACSGSLQVSSDNFSTCVQMDTVPSASNSDKTFTIFSSSNLDNETTFKVRITSVVKDRAGNTLASDYMMANGFKTADISAPILSVVSEVASPTNDTTPSFTFSSNESGTVSDNGSTCSFTSQSISAGNTILTFGSLASGTYSSCMIVVTDLSANTTALYVNTFTVDVNPPQLDNVSPSDSSTGTSINTSITLRFSEPMDNTTLTTNTSDTTCSGSLQFSLDNFSSCVKMSALPSASNFNRIFTVRPAASIKGETVYKIRVTSRVKDTVGNQLGSNYETAFITEDNARPVLSVSNEVSTSTNDQTPDFSFTSNETGTISYFGSCSSSMTNAVSGTNQISFNTLTEGTYNDCKIRVTDNSSNFSELDVNNFIVDVTPPTVYEVTPVKASTSDTTPSYTFSSTEAGIISYTGSCSSSDISALAGNNSVDFNALTEGIYNDCSITVTDSAGNIGSLPGTYLRTFTVDITTPLIAEVSSVTTPGSDITPSYTFSSSEAGTISYGGSCSSNETSALADNNTITFNILNEGIYSNCTIAVADSAGNSGSLNVSAFVIDTTSPTVSSINPLGGATSVSVNSSIRITFSESIDSSSVVANTYNTYCSGSLQVSSDNFTSCIQMNAAPLASNSGKTFMVSPSSSLTGETVYMMKVTTDVKDSVGNPLAGNYETSSGFTTEDNTAPVLSISTGVKSPTNDQTPDFSLNSTEAGTITYLGSCSSSTTSAVSGYNLITFDTLTEGNYSNCKIRVTDGAGNLGQLQVNTFNVDVTQPTVHEVTPVAAATNDTTPNFKFSSTEAGIISFQSGDACSSSYASASEGSNTIELNTLGEGSYSCTLIVTDPAGNQGQVSMSTFVVDTTAPTLTEVTSVTTPGNDATPDYTFSSNEDGVISYLGSCSSSSNTAANGNNTVTFNNLGSGTYSSCRVMVSDAAGNQESLSVSTFTIDVTSPTVASINPADNEITISVNTSVAVTFSEKMQTSSVTANSSSTSCTGIVQLSMNDFSSCIRMSGDPTVSNDDKTFTLNPASNLSGETTYKIRVTSLAKDVFGNAMNSTYTTLNGFNTADVSSPGLREITVISTPANDTTPSYVFSSSESGTITYSGLCSSSTTNASTGNNAITFNTLTDGSYSNCTITVRDSSNNDATLGITSFTIDATAPVLSEVTPVTTPTNSRTPSYTFASTEAGTISYEGDCNSSTTSASSNNNPVTFNTLSVGTHNNCRVRVTDGVGNVSNPLSVTSFTIDETRPEVKSVTPVDNSTNIALNTSISVEFTKSMDISTVTVNTSNSNCSGSLQVSSNNFSTCVQMNAAPSPSNSNKTFSTTPMDNLTDSTKYKIRATTSLRDTGGNFIQTLWTSNGISTDWRTQLIGGIGSDHGYGIAVDQNSDEIYVVGHTQSDLHGKSVIGSRDFFLIKYNSHGGREWTQVYGISRKRVEGRKVVIGSDGSIYVVGQTNTDIGDNPIKPSGTWDYFIMKFSPNGNLQIIHEFGTNREEKDYIDIAIDSSDNLFVAGATKGLFDNAKNEHGNVSDGEYPAIEFFMAKFDSNLLGQSSAMKWVRQFGGDNTAAFAIAVDSKGNAYATGVTRKNSRFSLLGENRNGKKHDTFVLKINSSGSVQWIKQYGVNDHDKGRNIAIDKNDHIYVVGEVWGSLPNYPTGGYNDHRNGRLDGFLSKFYDNGTILWNTQSASAGFKHTWDRAKAVGIDTNNKVYVLMEKYKNNPNNQHGKLILAKYYDNGTLSCKGTTQSCNVRMGTVPNKYDVANDLAVDSSGIITVVGTSPNGGTVERKKSLGSDDIMIFRFNDNMTKIPLVE